MTAPARSTITEVIAVLLGNAEDVAYAGGGSPSELQERKWAEYRKIKEDLENAPTVWYNTETGSLVRDEDMVDADVPSRKWRAYTLIPHYEHF